MVAYIVLECTECRYVPLSPEYMLLLAMFRLRFSLLVTSTGCYRYHTLVVHRFLKHGNRKYYSNIVMYFNNNNRYRQL